MKKLPTTVSSCRECSYREADMFGMSCRLTGKVIGFSSEIKKIPMESCPLEDAE